MNNQNVDKSVLNNGKYIEYESFFEYKKIMSDKLNEVTQKCGKSMGENEFYKEHNEKLLEENKELKRVNEKIMNEELKNDIEIINIQNEIDYEISVKVDDLIRKACIKYKDLIKK